MRTTFAGAALPLAPEDWRRAAERLRVPESRIRGVWQVECGGSPWLIGRDGIRPKILFEAHHFDRRTSGRYRSTHPDLSAPRWDRSLYVGGPGEYDRLYRAMDLDAEAALLATSWGAPQIMGFNHGAAGFGDVAAFVAAMADSEGAQLLAFCGVVEAWGLADELRRGDADGFATAYNGAGQAVHGYAGRIAAAWARQAMLSRETVAAAPLATVGGAEKAALAGERAEIAAVQAALNAAGAAPPLTVDGWGGIRTTAAIRAFQAGRGLPVDGIAGPLTRRALGI